MAVLLHPFVLFAGVVLFLVGFVLLLAILFPDPKPECREGFVPIRLPNQGWMCLQDGRK